MLKLELEKVSREIMHFTVSMEGGGRGTRLGWRKGNRHRKRRNNLGWGEWNTEPQTILRSVVWKGAWTLPIRVGIQKKSGEKKRESSLLLISG